MASSSRGPAEELSAASAAAGVAKNPRRVIKAFSVQRSAFSEGGLLTAEC